MSVATDNRSRIRVGTILHGDKLDTIPVLAHHGFESIGLYLFGEVARQIDWPAAAEQVRRGIGEADMVVSTLSIYVNALADPADVTAWERAIDNAHLFECDIVAGFTGRVVDRPVHDSMRRFTEVFGELARRAADRGVRIAFENWNGNGNWWRGDWNMAHHPAAWEMIFDAVPSDNLGLQWEPCHQMMLLMDPLRQLREWAPKVFNVHGKDAEISWDKLRAVGVDSFEPDGSLTWAKARNPGFGDTNWHGVIDVLAENGYRGSIDIEGFHDDQHGGQVEFTSQLTALAYLKLCRGIEPVPNPWERG